MGGEEQSTNQYNHHPINSPDLFSLNPTYIFHLPNSLSRLDQGRDSQRRDLVLFVPYLLDDA